MSSSPLTNEDLDFLASASDSDLQTLLQSMTKAEALRLLTRLENHPSPKERLENYAVSPGRFRRDLLIDRGGVSVRLGDCLDEWQDRDFRAMDESWLRCVGREVQGNPPMRGWFERPRGHSKTSDLAIMAVWALAFSARPIRGFCAAGDRDQAALLRKAIERLMQLNPFLAAILAVQNNRVRNVAEGNPGRGSELEILSSDAGTSFGHLGDFFIIDEPSHWKDRGEDLWVSLLSAVAKRSTALLVVILNAGWKEHWCYKVAESVRESPGWYYSHLSGCQASWMREDVLDEQRRLLPSNEFNRLYGNIWQEGKGEGINPIDIKRAIVLEGPYRERPANVHEVCLGLDLAYTSHSAALVAVGWDAPRQKLVLLDNKRWSPAMFPDGKINQGVIKEEILRFQTRFNCPTIVSDRWEAIRLLEEIAATRLFQQVLSVPITSKSKGEQARAMLDALSAGMLELYEGDLAQDLRRASIIETPSGLRIEWAEDERGHGDSAAALSVLLPGMVADLKQMGAMT